MFLRARVPIGCPVAPTIMVSLPPIALIRAIVAPVASEYLADGTSEAAYCAFMCTARFGTPTGTRLGMVRPVLGVVGSWTHLSGVLEATELGIRIVAMVHGCLV